MVTQEELETVLATYKDAWETQDPDLIFLNVGGTVMSTTYSTV